MRQVHAEGLRERRNHAEGSTTGLAGATISHECRICGADHGTERHTTCPECGLTPRDFYSGPWGPHGEYGDETLPFPFRTDTSWASRRVKVLD